jgi:hypothetical protein
VIVRRRAGWGLSRPRGVGWQQGADWSLACEQATAAGDAEAGPTVEVTSGFEPPTATNNTGNSHTPSSDRGRTPPSAVRVSGWMDLRLSKPVATYEVASSDRAPDAVSRNDAKIRPAGPRTVALPQRRLDRGAWRFQLSALILTATPAQSQQPEPARRDFPFQRNRAHKTAPADSLGAVAEAARSLPCGRQTSSRARAGSSSARGVTHGRQRRLGPTCVSWADGALWSYRVRQPIGTNQQNASRSRPGAGTGLLRDSGA